jgi:hypothetical protein
MSIMSYCHWLVSIIINMHKDTHQVIGLTTSWNYAALNTRITSYVPYVFL